MAATVLYNGGQHPSTTNNRGFGYARQEVLFDGAGAEVVALVIPFDAKLGIGGLRIQNLTNSAFKIETTLEQLDNKVDQSNTPELAAKAIWSQVNASLAASAMEYIMPPLTGFKFTPDITPVAITAMSWLAGVVTVTAAGHGLVTGQDAMISGVTPAGYNGLQTVTVTDANTFTYPLVTDPGLVTVQGSVSQTVAGKLVILGT